MMVEYRKLISQIQITPKTPIELLNIIKNELKNETTALFTYYNTYTFFLISTNNNFKQAFNKFNYVVADGTSITFAKRILTGERIKKTVYTYFFKSDLLKFLSREKIKTFFLGSREETIIKAVENVKKQYGEFPLNYHQGFFNIERDTDKVVELINRFKPEILVIGMGMPRSEIWIAENYNKIHAKIIISAGAIFEFLSNNKKSAPRIFYNSGFEWLFRLIQEPVRLSKRYLQSHPLFLIQLCKEIFHETKQYKHASTDQNLRRWRH